MSSLQKKRDISADFFRGLAMLLVVLGHTVSGCTKDYENSLIFNIIWTLQMPMFMLISGYVTRYSRNIDSVKGLLKYLLSKTLAYMLPFAVWTFLVRGVILRQTYFFDIKNLLWNTDAGYWFLISIWSISVIFSISRYIASRISKKFNVILTLVFCAVFSSAIALVGLTYGMSFFAIKYTLYYTPFFLLGYVFSQLYVSFGKEKWFSMSVDIAVFLSVVLYFLLIMRFNFYTQNDSVINIALRASASVFGCISLIGLLNGIASKSPTNKLSKFILFIGTNSLGIYVCHSLFLSLLKPESLPLLSTFAGYITVIVNFIATVAVTSLAVYLLQRNKYLRKVLFYK